MAADRCLGMELAMQDQVMELAERGKALSTEDRSRLVDLLLESLDEAPLADVETAWNEEAERRLEAYDRGDLPAIDGDLVLTRARALAKR